MYIYIYIAIGAIGRSPADTDEWCRSSVLISPFQSDSLILLYLPDGTLSQAQPAGSLLLLSPKLRYPRCRRSEHTSKRMQQQMPRRAASPLKQKRWTRSPMAKDGTGNSGSPKPKSEKRWLVTPETKWSWKESDMWTVKFGGIHYIFLRR